MANNYHGCDLSTLIGEEFIAMGVCYHNHRRDWEVSRLLQELVDGLNEIRSHMSPLSPIVPCKSLLISKDVVHTLCCLRIVLSNYVIVVKQSAILSFHML